MKNNNITAVVLAGGRAIRMNGVDKGLIELAGETIISRVTSQLATQVDTILINANRNLDQYRQYDFAVLPDSLSDFQGPLAGMLTALENINTEWLITCPCDGPFIAQDYCQRMMESAKQESTQLAVASDGNRLQPVYALIHKNLKTSLIEFLASGDRKIDRWYDQHNYATVAFDQTEKMFTNINTPEQLAELELQY